MNILKLIDDYYVLNTLSEREKKIFIKLIENYYSSEIIAYMYAVSFNKIGITKEEFDDLANALFELKINGYSVISNFGIKDNKYLIYSFTPSFIQILEERRY